MTITLEDDRWDIRAACKDRGVDMWPDWDNAMAVAKARAICAPCPVKAECLAAANSVDHRDVDSVRAGYTGPERRYYLRNFGADVTAWPEPGRPGERRCQKCGGIFLARTANNRVCPDCRSRIAKANLAGGAA